MYLRCECWNGFVELKKDTIQKKKKKKKIDTRKNKIINADIWRNVQAVSKTEK